MYISCASLYLEHTILPLAPFSSTFSLRLCKCSAPVTAAGPGCLFHSGHRCYPLITMANQIACQPAPIIKMTQINSLAMSQYIHSTYTDMAKCEAETRMCLFVFALLHALLIVMICFSTLNLQMRIICQLFQPEWSSESKRERVDAFFFQHSFSFAIFCNYI
jgi:hypothetical protein